MPSGVEKEPSHFKIQEGPGSDEFDGREVGPEEETEEEQGRFEWPDSNFDRFIYIFSFPFLVAFLLTIPDCGRDVETYNCCGRSFTIDWSKWFVATFIVSIFWIAGLTVSPVPNKQYLLFIFSTLMNYETPPSLTLTW